MFARSLTPVAMALMVACFTLVLHANSAAAALPNGFENRLVTADIPNPTAMDFTPDGRLLVASKGGQLHVFEDGATTQAMNIGPRVCDNSERGLLGVAVDPDFGTAAHNYVYLYYTYKKSGACPLGDPGDPHNPVNRVSRFVMSGDNVDPDSEEVLIDNIPSPKGNHNAGDVKFGRDEYLYISVGDGGCDYAEETNCQYENDASRDRHILLGKVLRIERDGGIPASNPYTGPDSDRCHRTGRTDPGNNCRETFVRGFRNPFRMAFDPDSSEFRINDVGGQRWEEIDRARAGADYGWNLCEGNHDNPYRGGSVNCSGANYTGPIHEYSHKTGCESITGGAFVPDGFWPASYDDAYLFGDYVCGKIFKLTPKDGGGFGRTEFAAGLGKGGPIAMTFGPYRTTGEALYYTTFVNGGEVRRISYTDGNLAPVADANADPNYGDNDPAADGLTIDFDASGSSDPDGNEPLTYVWDFGDGTTPVETTDPTASHAYQTAGKYTATLTVRDSLGEGSDPDKIEVFPGNTPPEPVIESPPDETLFRVGQEITLTGSATDAEDGPITLRWEVRQHHDGNHFHPLASGTGEQLTFTGPRPEGLYSTDPMQNYLEIRLTATDSQGLSKTVSEELRPKTVDVTFETRPAGFRLKVNGETFTAPRSFVSWEGYRLNVLAPRQEDSEGRLWGFRSWSDGRPAEHTIRTPADATTYTATFRRL